MNRAVEFEGNRPRAVRASRAGRAWAGSVLLAALAVAGCERSKVVIELHWDEKAINDPTGTMISVVFEDKTLPESDPRHSRVQFRMPVDTRHGLSFPVHWPW